MKAAPHLHRRYGALLLCLLLGAVFSVLRGQDSSWDLKNYHLFNPWAVLHQHGVLYGDIAPAGLQSYFNPLPDLPYLWLAEHGLDAWPRWLAAVQGLWFGAVLFVLWEIVAELARQQGRRPAAVDCCAYLIGISGTMLISQAGLSSNEVMIALLVLSGVRTLLPALSAAGHARPQLLTAGLCCGLAAGIKPTAIVYAPALALALLCSHGQFSRRLQQTLWFTAAATAGFAITYGWWGWLLYRHTGNPVFPLFNQVFHSPLTTTDNLTDQRFKPKSLAQWLGYPFYWLGHNKMRVTEPTFADPRYALAMLAMLALAWRQIWRRGRSALSTMPGNAGGLLVRFVAVAYLLWLLLYSILRYAIPIEALTGIIILLAVQAWVPAAAPRWGATGLMGLCLLLAAAGSDYPGWGHSRYAGPHFGIQPPAIAAGSTVILLGQPTAYLVPFIPQAETMHLIGINELTAHSRQQALWRQTQAAILSASGPLVLIRRDDSRAEAAILHKLVPDLQFGPCQPIHSALERGRNGKDFSQGLRICQLSLPQAAKH